MPAEVRMRETVMMVERSREVAELVSEIRKCQFKTNEEWIQTLDSRKLAELQFHDQDRASDADGRDGKGKDAGNRKYYSTAGSSQQYVRDWIRKNAQGRIFLDYACGAGTLTLEAAKAGAALAIGLDVSEVSVRLAERRANEAGVSENTLFVQGDCENTGLPSGSIDAVICSGMLHHLDLSYAFPELRRILKPRGVVLAVEALSHNPFIKLYRALTPSMRTEWEKGHILSLRDLRFAQRFFKVRKVRYWHFFSIMATPLRNLPGFRTTLWVANALDSALLRVMPFSLLAWMFTFEMEKRD